MSTITLLIVIVVLLLLFGGGGGYYYSRRPSGAPLFATNIGSGVGILGFVLILLLILYLLGVI
jgi:hypothetical protein